MHRFYLYMYVCVCVCVCVLYVYKYETQLKSSLAVQDILMECDQMRFNFQHNPSSVMHTSSIDIAVLGFIGKKKVNNSKYDIFLWIFQPTHVCVCVCVCIYIYIYMRYPWCNGYRHRKWTRRHEFKSWTRLIAFHIALILLKKAWIQLVSLQLWVNSRADWVLQPWWGN